ncbi:uncharacterized protein K02A2.6-like [Amphibalanus amphitrite]|uniref:uncharacterized protein K02A2.6-like n=1 Tax=Amphibalanus amphitrite TaxID=1232801 RepID=UPI001C929607|nr:uncharacterized protein K02A2.6-like [Amphibalanus amphitrite]XP_043247447.1 uncharacterized protein K02A2.6-like [Amphibalanus amphitrite]
MLNRHVRRGAHPPPSCNEVVASIDKSSKFFSKFDAKNGYFQVPLADESKDLTTFITPWGRFRFERCVQGLSSSGDEFNRRGDVALAGIPRTCKVTDDILCHDDTYASHLKHVITVLERCKEHNITLNPTKLQFAQSTVEYCGFNISKDGYTVDRRKLRAISDFPVPQNLTDLRSFMGLVNQLASFSTDTASAASPLRDLLRPQNHWCWTSVHQQAFEAVKATLVSPPVLAFFKPGLPTALHTDATRLHGLSSDEEYQALADTILNGFPDQKADLPSSLRAYWQVKEDLSVNDGIILCGARLLVPRSLRRDVLKRLHAGHQGIERTKRRARQSVYWPGLNQQVHETVTACSACRKYLPTQQKEPMLSDPEPSRVFETMSADFFSHAGKSWLVIADRLSGWPIAVSIDGEPTSRILVSHLREVFAVYGVPNQLKTDGGPQFTARHTRTFLERWGVTHTISSLHYPQSNGHAEAAVKAVKRLVQKCSVSGRLDLEEFSQAMLKLRNTPREDGRSPAEVLFGHPLRTMVPMHHSAFACKWQQAADECDKRAHTRREAARERYDAAARPLPSLKIGSNVAIQNNESGLWDRSGVIVAIGRYRAYLVKLASGRTLWRNRRFLRPYRPLVPVSERRTDTEATAPATAATATTPQLFAETAERGIAAECFGIASCVINVWCAEYTIKHQNKSEGERHVEAREKKNVSQQMSAKRQ